METFSALLALCAGNSPVTVEFLAQRPVTPSFHVFFDLHLNKRLSKQSRCRWFQTQSRHCNESCISCSIMYSTSRNQHWFRRNEDIIHEHHLRQSASSPFVPFIRVLFWYHTFCRYEKICRYLVAGWTLFKRIICDSVQVSTDIWYK